MRILSILVLLALLIQTACQNNEQKKLNEATTAWLPEPDYQPNDPAVLELIDSATVLQVSARQEPGLRPEQRAARLRRAQAKLQQALQIDPKYGLAYSNLAAIALEQGDTVASRKHLQKRLELEPQLVQGWLFLGNLYDFQGDSLQAFERYEQALELVNARLALGKGYTNPSDVAYYYDNWALKAQCLLLLGRDQEARKELDQLLEAARPVLGEQVRNYAALKGLNRNDLLGRSEQ